MLPTEGYNLILAGALISITLNPVLFRLIGPLEAWFDRPADTEEEPGPVEIAVAVPRDHVVLCGYGRVGRMLAGELAKQAILYLVVDWDRGLIEGLHRRGIAAFHGDVLEHATLKQLHLDTARLLVVAMSDPIATRHLVEEAYRQHPDLPIVARTHSESERQYLRQHRVDAIFAERALALTMNRHALARLGVAVPADPDEARLQAV
jgi:CPA2 family monovalent cation:H+ antiporter-2